MIPAPFATRPLPGSFAKPGELTCDFRPLSTAEGWLLDQLARRAARPVRPATPGSATPGSATAFSGADLIVEIVAADRLPEIAAVPTATGLAPFGEHVDERFSLVVTERQVVLRAPTAAALTRGIALLGQLLTAPSIPAQAIVDGPRFAWRGLSLDVVRHPLPMADIKRVVDLVWAYRMNVLHLHLTDDEGWRISATRGSGVSLNSGHLTDAELAELVSYAAARHVQVVPEFDTPGHTRALLELHPELVCADNLRQLELLPGHSRQVAWLDPGLPATGRVIGELLDWAEQVFPGPYLHIGGDEPWGMPPQRYREYVSWLLAEVRERGRVPIGWQEIARTGPPPGQVIQHWITPSAFAGAPGAASGLVQANVSAGAADISGAIRAGWPVIVSPHEHCYLDVAYADEPGDDRSRRLAGEVGAPFYHRGTLARSFQWDPVEALGPAASVHNVAGVEAALWSETVRGFEDVCFLLLPRLAGVAEKAWSPAGQRSWPEHQKQLTVEQAWWIRADLAFFRPAHR